MMTSKRAAKDAVIGIAKEYGFIRPSSLDEIGRMNPEIRHEIEESMLAKDKKMAHSIKTCAPLNRPVILKEILLIRGL